MTKKVHLLFILALFCFNIAQAQNASIGFFGGGNARNISYGSEKFKHLNLGPDFGAFAEIRLAENISIQPMLEYSAQGSKNGAFVSTSNYYDPSFQNDVKFGELNYLMIPVLAKVSFGFGERSPLRLYTSFGPYAAYLLSADQVLITRDGEKNG